MLTNKLLQIGIGVLLGDASIQRNSSKSVTKHRLKFLQSRKHKDYIFHLHNEFRLYVSSPPYYNKKRDTYSFQTVFHTDFNVLADIFLNKAQDAPKKSVSCFFKLNSISPISLAYWFMDDGGQLAYNKDYIRKGVVFNTQNFPRTQVEILSDNLNTHYGLESWIKSNKNKPIIAISGKKYHHIERIMLPFIIPSMRYKLPSFKEKNTQKLRITVGINTQ